ncbi:hypothetical protein [Methylobacterium sp. WL6]|uniref:hypothetical protein n=1 Tax=Methylobacterium sp. WL6 TaxID=2603901 RepID=UPI0011C935E8|nr:hypothetical protein [Methylobacterium sp. WL6]TXN70484.1 hypothetical protein FV230_10555 [Methylobacterium sp. WL6]
MAAAHCVSAVPVTFGEFVNQLAELPLADLALRETLQEFADFALAENLVPRDGPEMVAMLTDTS